MRSMRSRRATAWRRGFGRGRMSDSTSNLQEMPPEVRRGVLSWIAKALGGLVFFGLLLFLTSGHLDWIWAWVFLGLFALASIANVAILIPTNPALLAARARGVRADTKGWDRVNGRARTCRSEAGVRQGPVRAQI